MDFPLDNSPARIEPIIDGAGDIIIEW
jgi:hypothetical protein